MGLKLNIRPELEEEMESLYAFAGARSKTEYINMAIAEMNRRQKRKLDINQLKSYFADPEYQQEVKDLGQEFAQLRGASND